MKAKQHRISYQISGAQTRRCAEEQLWMIVKWLFKKYWWASCWLWMRSWLFQTVGVTKPGEPSILADEQADAEEITNDSDHDFVHCGWRRPVSNFFKIRDAIFKLSEQCDLRNGYNSTLST
jgi:hypothetical protein